MNVGDSTDLRSRLDEIAEALPTRAAMLSRLFLAQSSVRVSRTEAGVLQALAGTPRRVTDLAAREGVTQPAITLVVNRLERRGWVVRESDPLDGRVVIVALTGAGHHAWDQLRREYQALLHEEMVTLEEADVEVLSRAIEILDRLISAVRDQTQA
ncbi:MAG: MarR family winged helix-turn-helix transcriptional regulator [Solirubrobacteraceae bacterium]